MVNIFKYLVWIIYYVILTKNIKNTLLAIPSANKGLTELDSGNHLHSVDNAKPRHSKYSSNTC